jgi:hypothetical protein
MSSSVSITSHKRKGAPAYISEDIREPLSIKSMCRMNNWRTSRENRIDEEPPDLIEEIPADDVDAAAKNYLRTDRRNEEKRPNPGATSDRARENTLNLLSSLYLNLVLKNVLNVRNHSISVFI